LRGAVIAAGLARPEALGEEAPLDVEVEDQRDDRAVPLPEIATRRR
jgi:hypothetical protein